MNLFVFMLIASLSGLIELSQATPWSIGLGQGRHQKLSVEEVLKQPYLTAGYQDGKMEIEYQVRSFNLKVIAKQDGVTNDFEITYGNRLTQEQLSAISRLTSGGLLEFSNMAGTCDVCVLHKFNDFVVEIN